MKFILWYYTGGIRSYFDIWENYLSFFWYFFSISRLLRTLFSPWKKDVLRKNWQGWNPILSLQNFALNNVFRLYGAMARMTIIIFGIFIELIVLLVGLFFFLIWILYPVVFVATLVGIISGELSFILLFIALALVGLMIFWGYYQSKKAPYSSMDLSQLSRQLWFQRVLDRIGLRKEDISKGFWKNQSELRKVLKNHNLKEEEFENILGWELALQSAKKNARKFWKKENLFTIPPVGRYWSYGWTNYLDKYAIELSKHDPTEYGDVQLFGYKNELEMLKLALARKNENNVLLYGDPGVGKKSVVHFLAKQIRRGKVGDDLEDKRVMMINIGEVVSSVVDQGGDAEHAVHSLFQEAAYAEDIILVINQVGKYLGSAEQASSVNIGAIIGEYLSLASFRMIVTASRSSYVKLTKKHENITKNFQSIEIKEPSEEETYKILLHKFSVEEIEKVVFTYQALREIIRSSAQLGMAVPLPERAIDLASETLLYYQKNNLKIITPEEVSQVIEMKTGTQQGKIEEDEKQKLLNLENILHQRVIGQELAIKQIADSVRKMRAGIRNKKKPVGSYLFMGPTGVGKTETAKALAESYFGNEEKMIRIDMSEYQSAESIDRMIGSTRTGRPGIITSKVEQNPFSLILLDEIEKAYSDILNLFLQVLDEGFITDAFGKKVSFRGAIIIATSNAGSVLLKNMVQQELPAHEIKPRLIDHVVAEGIFRVEFLNRFNDVIFFKSLTDEQLKKVIGLMLQRFIKRLQEGKNIEIEFGEGITEKIIEKGYEPIFGARSINRYIADNVEDLVAKKMIAQEIQPGGKLIITKEDLE